MVTLNVMWNGKDILFFRTKQNFKGVSQEKFD